MIDGSMWTWNTFVVLGGTTALGMGSGMLGSLAVLRRESLVGDAVAHAALPGLCLAYIWSGSKSLPLLILGAAISGMLGVWLIGAARRHTRLKPDAIIGSVLSVFFGAGTVLMVLIQKQYSGGASGLNSYIFGKPAAMVGSDVIWIVCLALGILAMTLLFFKEFMLISFDPGYAQSLGYPVWWLSLLFLFLLTAEVVVGLQAVGVVLMAGLLIIPGASARLWTQRLSRMMWISALLGMAAGGLGTLVSAWLPNAPAGPTIILIAAGFFLISLIVAPERGLVARAWELHRMRQRMRHQHLLRAVYEYLEENRLTLDAILPVTAFAAYRQTGVVELVHELDAMVRVGWARAHGDHYSLTPDGQEAVVHATRVHRLWEEYFRLKTDVPLDELHQQADRLEHSPIEPPSLSSVKLAAISAEALRLAAGGGGMAADGGGSAAEEWR